MITVQPYEKIGLVYDHILQHIDYADWAGYIADICVAHNHKPLNSLDLACGTGAFINELQAYEINVHGMDLSSSMVEMAQKRTGLDGGRIRCGNMTTDRFEQSFDLVSCLFDSINYLLQPAAVTAFIDHVNAQLTDSGLFIFDVVTQRACKEYFFDFTETDTVDGIDYERHCTYDLNSNEQHSHFTIQADGKTFTEHHVQKIYSLKEVDAIIEASTMQTVAIYSDFELEKPDRYTERAHYVLESK